MYNTGSNYGSGPSMGAMNQLQITSGSSGSMLQKLSFLSPGEQQKFEQLYKQSVPDPSQQLTGEAARDIFLRSKLDPEILAQIWSLADVNVSGTLTFAEFALAMYLINMKLTGQNVPTQLPNNLRQEIISAMQASSTGAPSTAYPGYSPSGPTIPGVTTPLGGPMSGMSTSSPQYNGQSQSKPSNPTRSQWAVTVEEKAKFDEIFKSLDNAHSGFLSGEKARQVFTESGLNKSDLAKIWGLADIHNQGKLNSDEFAVAMHLIYAKIGGKEIPKSLPMNLVPPSTKDLSDSVSSLKQMLKTNKSNSLLSSPIPGIPKMDFDLDSADLNAARKAVLQDEDIGYVSSNRRKVGSSPKPASPKISYSERLAKFDVIRKQIKEKKLELEKLSSKTMDSDATVPGNEAELAALKKKILDLQRSINEAPASNTLANGRSEYDPVGSGQERKQLEAEFNELTSELPNLTKKVQSLDEKIAELQLELFKITDAKLHKTAPSKTNLANLFPFKASGSGDSLSEADRLKQKAAEMLAQRMQALTKPNTSANDPSVAEAKKRLDAATDKINQEKRGNEQYIREIEASLRQSQNEIRDIIQRTTQSGGPTSATSLSREDYQREKRKWDSRFGLESETKQFLDELKKIESKPTSPAQSHSSSYSRPSFISSTGADTSSKASPTLSKPSPLASAKSKEEKDRIIKEEAERRLKERQAFFQAQLQKTKEQKQSSQAEKSSDYSAFGKSTTPEQKDGWKSSTASESTNVRKPSDSPQAPTSLSSSAVLSSPPSVSQSEEGLLGGYKTLWLNKPSSTKSEEPTPQSSVPSFISKSKNPFPTPQITKSTSPTVPEPSNESSSEDEDDAEQERAFRERIEKAKREERERQEAHHREQEAIREATKAAREKAKDLELSSLAESNSSAFISHSNNVFSGLSFGDRSTEPSHSPKDDEWDVVEKPTNSATSSSKFDEIFGVPTEVAPHDFHSTTFDDAFNISPNLPTHQEPSSQSRKPAAVSEDSTVLFRARTLYDYQSDNADDLGFRENDYIQVSQVNDDDNDWWYGELESSGAKGWFPKSYVEREGSAPGQASFRARVLYDYSAQQGDEMSLHADAVIEILEKIDENWWRAQVEGRVGLVPATYCEELTQ